MPDTPCLIMLSSAVEHGITFRYAEQGWSVLVMTHRTSILAYSANRTEILIAEAFRQRSRNIIALPRSIKRGYASLSATLGQSSVRRGSLVVLILT